jgi:hypothetical protein
MRKAAIVPMHSTPAQRMRIVVRWINAGVVVGMLLAAGLGAMALAGANSSHRAAALDSEPAEYTAAEKRLERSGVLLAYEILL